jgi:nicotinamidase-related amidase
MSKVKRLAPGRCFGGIIDVQSYFLAQLGKALRTRIEQGTGELARLLDHFNIPVVVTIEQPVDRKGLLPPSIGKHLGHRAETFEKNFFDLSKESPIRRHLKGLKRQQAIIAGCETDVCVMQSCLGLLGLGYEVYVIEDLLFSSARAVDSAIARMKAEGAVFLTFKTLLYELAGSVDASGPAEMTIE